MGFWPSKTVLSAVELELFTQLGSESMTGEEVAGRIGLHSRATYDFLDTLVALGLLERDGDGPDGRYRNTPDTAVFLDKNSPAYIGGILEMANARLYRFWGDLTEALQTGSPQNEIKHTGKAMFEELYSDPARLEQFMGAMAGISRGNFEALAQKFDFSRYRTRLRRGRRHRRAQHGARQPPPAPLLHHLRPAGRGADRGEGDCGGGALGPRVRGLGRLLRGRVSQGRRDHDGPDPPRLESRPEAPADPRRPTTRCRRAEPSSSSRT